MTVTLPAEMTYGRVVGRWILAVADTPNDPDDLPEAQVPTGTVSFTRINTYSVRPDTTQADGTYVGILKQNVSTTLGSDGELRLSPTAPPGVWLVTGFYKVNATISGMQWPSFDIEVTTEHTQENPLDLIHATPIVVSPTTVLVPSYETKDSAEAAAASAEQSAIDAAQSASEADLSAQSASSSAVSAAVSAASISEALPMMENLVINGDFSDGTTGWNVGGYSVVQDGYLIKNNPTSNAYQDVVVPNGHRVFVSAKAAAIAPANTRIRAFDYGLWVNFVDVILTANTAFTRGSCIKIATNGGLRLDIGYGNEGAALVDDIIAIDLTAVFGAGNEPTKEQMDEIITYTGWFDGKKAAPLHPWVKHISDYLLVGTGSPVNVVTPVGIGVEYIDTAATTGARKWISTGGNNTTWKVLDGDTGYRDISNLVTFGWTTLYPSTLRRTGDVVTLRIIGLKAADPGVPPSGEHFMNSISGFRSLKLQGWFFGQSGITFREQSGYWDIVTPNPNNAHYTTITFVTADEWPTTLPGTPA